MKETGLEKRMGWAGHLERTEQIRKSKPQRNHFRELGIVQRIILK
jgi:hypothetical protein